MDLPLTLAWKMYRFRSEPAVARTPKPGVSSHHKKTLFLVFRTIESFYPASSELYLRHKFVTDL
jgi:hypothetical protein